jgi:hypothetical protein
MPDRLLRVLQRLAKQRTGDPQVINHYITFQSTCCPSVNPQQCCVQHTSEHQVCSARFFKPLQLRCWQCRFCALCGAPRLSVPCSHLNAGLSYIVGPYGGRVSAQPCTR